MNRSRSKKEYLKGKSIFIVSLLVIGVTILTIYLTGENYNRSLTLNLYISLSIIGTVLFLFMTYGLYRGIELTDDFPKFRSFKNRNIVKNKSLIIDSPPVDLGGGIIELIISVLLWIGMAILIIILMVLLEAVFWLSFFIILTTLYWVFFRALKLVFSKSRNTKGNIVMSIVYSISYTMLYLGWIFVIVYFYS